MRGLELGKLPEKKDRRARQGRARRPPRRRRRRSVFLILAPPDSHRSARAVAVACLFVGRPSIVYTHESAGASSHSTQTT